MKKLNFATRVTVARVQRSDASASAVTERTKLQAEINSRPVIIDKSVFRKSDAEKAELKIEKAHWKRKMSI